MAIEVSNNQVVQSYKNIFGNIYPSKNNTFLKKLVIKILQKIFPIIVFFINLKRRLVISFIKEKNNSVKIDKKIEINLPDENLKNIQSEGWCFIKNFLDEESYKMMIDSWPNKNFFKLRSKSIKYFSTGFYCKNKSMPLNLENYKFLKLFYNYLNGQEAESIISNFLGDKKQNFTCYSIASSISEKNNYLAPHRDGIASKNMGNKVYNFIYFVDGNNEIAEYSGATGIYQDNEFKNPIFIPKNLRNTCLVYDSTDRFFHGFKTMSNSGYRKVITFQFFHKDLLNN